MKTNEEDTFYPAAGCRSALIQNIVILILLLLVSSVVVYYCTLLMLKSERKDNFYFAIFEILGVIGACVIAVFGTTKRMAYLLDSSSLGIQYGLRGYRIEYQDIQDIQILEGKDFFDGDLRMPGPTSKMNHPYGASNEAFLFNLYVHLRLGKVFVCATTKTDEFLLISMNNKETPSVLVAAENFNEFMNDLRSRLKNITTESKV